VPIQRKAKVRYNGHGALGNRSWMIDMKRVKGRYNGSTVFLEERASIPADTEVEVLIPDAQGEHLRNLLDELDRLPAGETTSLDEIVALVHDVRGGIGRG